MAISEPLGVPSPIAEDGTIIAANVDAARQMGLAATIYHWGLHPWAIYAIVALALALFTFNKGLPLTIRSTFYPLLGSRIYENNWSFLCVIYQSNIGKMIPTS
jgi:BCCT family betaine/carnitine transporter